MDHESVFVIGISGGTGSGKSSVVEVLKHQFPQDVSVLSFDNYYKEQHDLSYEERRMKNYDCPDAFDFDLVYDHILKLSKWEAIECPIYDFSIDDRTDESILIEPKKILIVEGIFALYDERIRNLYNTKIYISVDKDVRILRRLKRDVEERGRTIDDIIRQYLKTVKPMHEKYVSHTKRYANIVIPKGASNKVAINMLIAHIRNYTNMWDLEKEYGFEPLKFFEDFD